MLPRREEEVYQWIETIIPNLTIPIGGDHFFSLLYLAIYDDDRKSSLFVSVVIAPLSLSSLRLMVYFSSLFNSSVIAFLDNGRESDDGDRPMKKWPSLEESRTKQKKEKSRRHRHPYLSVCLTVIYC